MINNEPTRKLLKRYHAQFNKSMTLRRQRDYYTKGSKMYQGINKALKLSQSECRKLDAMIFDRAVSQLISDEYTNHLKTYNK